jgi:hypothetical protein
MYVNYCSWQWTLDTESVTPWDALRDTGKEEGNFLGFQGMQCGMFIKLQNRYMTTYSCPMQPIQVPEFINFHILICVITEYNILHYTNSCHFLHCTVFEYDKFRTRFSIKHLSNILSVHCGGLQCMNCVLCCCDCNIIIFYLQCKRVGPECRKAMYDGGSWVPSTQIFMPRSHFADRLHDT